MKIFWSWQSDTPSKNNHFLIRDALNMALKQVEVDLDLTEAERPEVDHDTKGQPGMVAIVDTIFDKIDQAAVFVADLTYVGRSPQGKLLPNPNVMIALGYAIKVLGPERIILVSNAAYGCRPEDLPFDLRHRRAPISFNLPVQAVNEDRKKAQQALTALLTPALSGCLGLVRDQTAKQIVYPEAPTRAGDRSTWLSAGEEIKHLDHFHGGGTSNWRVAEQPRFYLRLIPAKYEGTKSPREVYDFNLLSRLNPWTDGEGGVNSLGAVVTGITMERSEVYAATQWFKKTGEVWAFSCRATFSRGEVGQRLLAWGNIPKSWISNLDQTLSLLEKLGVTGPILAEAGVTGLTDTFWPGKPYGRYPSIAEDAYLRRADTKWLPETRAAFLRDSFNVVAEAYNQRAFSVEEFLAI
jgi:hypothetical protein